MPISGMTMRDASICEMVLNPLPQACPPAKESSGPHRQSNEFATHSRA
jgi:hypothetical protein